jgi:hypothetical protein
MNPQPDAELEGMPGTPSSYGETLAFLAQSLQGMASGSTPPMEALNQFQHWIRSVQQVLEQTQRELEHHLGSLRGLDSVDTADVMEQFAGLRSSVSRHLGEIESLFQGCVTIGEFESRFPRIEGCLRAVEAEVEKVEAFVDGWGDDAQTVQPLPESLGETLNSMEAAMDALSVYFERRERQALEDMARELESAETSLRTFLAQN